MERYAGKDEFYAAYPRLARGWGNLDHTNAPGGWNTAFYRVRSEEDDSGMARETWSVAFACPYDEIQALEDSGTPGQEVGGAVVATSSRTGEVLVLTKGPDLRPAFAAIRERETASRRADDYTLEELAVAVGVA